MGKDCDLSGRGYVSTGQAGRMLGVARSTVRNMVRDGVLPAMREGRFFRIPKLAVQRAEMRYICADCADAAACDLWQGATPPPPR